ncbi:hypothetical protein [Psychromonas sp. KJ10-2]|uniref:hypothetical protein n=1 Tax=Psychromonas sp. KJ10-2 TaxID=3391822 RepID=UPI0039B38CD9
MIFDEMSFSISPNSSNRLAIASGKSGVLTFVPKSKSLSRSDVKEFTSSICTDVDWQSTVLLANTTSGVERADFKPMPLYNDFIEKSEFYEKFKEFKTYTPNVTIKDQAKLSWIGGDKVYSLNLDNTISVEGSPEGL